jgi:hypothetical protein
VVLDAEKSRRRSRRVARSRFALLRLDEAASPRDGGSGLAELVAKELVRKYLPVRPWARRRAGGRSHAERGNEVFPGGAAFSREQRGLMPGPFLRGKNGRGIRTAFPLDHR